MTCWVIIHLLASGIISVQAAQFAKYLPTKNIKELGILTKWDVKGLRTNKLGFWPRKRACLSPTIGSADKNERSPGLSPRVFQLALTPKIVRFLRLPHGEGCGSTSSWLPMLNFSGMINGKNPEIWRTLRPWRLWGLTHYFDMAMGQNLVPLVNIKIAGKWMFIPLKMVLIGIDPYPYRTWPFWGIPW